MSGKTDLQACKDRQQQVARNASCRIVIDETLDCLRVWECVDIVACGRSSGLLGEVRGAIRLGSAELSGTEMQYNCWERSEVPFGFVTDIEPS